MRIRRAILYKILAGVLLLLLLHFETITIGGIKVSHLWKIGLIIILIIYFLKVKVSFRIYWVLIILALIQFFNADFENSLLLAFSRFLNFILFVAIGLYFLKLDSTRIYHLLTYFALFIVASFVPYKLNILSSLGREYDLTSYGGDQGLIGPFQNPHTASMVLAFAVLFSLYHMINSSSYRLWLPIIILGFYFMIQTYVRTGLFMFLIGVVPIVFMLIKVSKTNFKILLFTLPILVISFYYSIGSNRILSMRLKGETLYNRENSFERLGSGRGLLIIKSLEIFKESSFEEKILGIGQFSQKERIKSKIGNSLVSHNGFLNFLLVNGVLGLSLYMLFVYNLYKCGSKLRDGSFHYLYKGFLLAYLVMVFFQDAERLYPNIFIFLGIAYSENNISTLDLRNETTIEDDSRGHNYN